METLPNSPQIVHVGLPEKNPQLITKLDEGIIANRLVERNEFINKQKKHLTSFTDVEQLVVARADQFVYEYCNRKLADLGLPPSSENNIPKPIYVKKMPSKNMVGGFSPRYGLIVVDANPQRRDLLVTSSAIMHESSHALAKTKNYLFWEEKKGQPASLELTETVGMPSIVKKKAKALLIEEGLAGMDTADFFLKYADKIDPQALEKRQGLRQNKIIKGVLKRLNNSIYGPIDFNQALSNIWSEKYTLPILGIKISLPYIGEVNIKILRTAEELCRTVGYVLSDSKEPAEDFIKIGRDFLDKSRITGSREGLEKIVEVFGWQTRKILNVDRDFKNIDSVMKLIRNKQKELSLVNQPSAGERTRTSTSY